MLIILESWQRVIDVIQRNVLFLPAVVHCPALVDRALTYANTSVTSYDTDVMVWCDHGYSLSGAPSVASTCTEKGEWHPQLPPCKCEYLECNHIDSEYAYVFYMNPNRSILNYYNSKPL